MEHLLWAHLWSNSEDTASSHKMLFSRTNFSCMLWISLSCMTFWVSPFSQIPLVNSQIFIEWLLHSWHCTRAWGISFKSIHLTFKEFGETKSKDLEQGGTAEDTTSSCCIFRHWWKGARVWRARCRLTVSWPGRGGLRGRLAHLYC